MNILSQRFLVAAVITLSSHAALACAFMTSGTRIVGYSSGNFIIRSSGDEQVGYFSGTVIISNSRGQIGSMNGTDVIYGNRIVASIQGNEIVARGRTVAFGAGGDCSYSALGAAYLLLFR